jgi:RNA polymerase sigma-70 factor (ECF subfamily)
MARSEPAKNFRLKRANEADERLLVEAAQRDASRFAALYENNFEVVYAYVARRVRDRAATEDLTSEVFHKALQHLPRFKWTGAPFAAWLLRIASNMIADRAKRVAREGNLPLNESEPSLTVGLMPDSASRSPQTQQTDLEDAERRAQMFKLIDELAGDQHRVVLMRFAEEKSIRQIAGELDRSEGAVKQLQFRALESLRKKLTRTRDE